MILIEKDLKTTANSNGIYSLFNGWLKEPVKDIIPDHVDLEPELTEFREKASKCKTIDEIDSFMDNIYKLRQTSILNDGEYGKGNLVFKQIRNDGIIDKLKADKVKLQNAEMSIVENIMPVTKLHEDISWEDDDDDTFEKPSKKDKSIKEMDKIIKKFYWLWYTDCTPSDVDSIIRDIFHADGRNRRLIDDLYEYFKNLNGEDPAHDYFGSEVDYIVDCIIKEDYDVTMVIDTLHKILGDNYIKLTYEHNIPNFKHFPEFFNLNEDISWEDDEDDTFEEDNTQLSPSEFINNVCNNLSKSEDFKSVFDNIDKCRGHHKWYSETITFSSKKYRNGLSFKVNLNNSTNHTFMVDYLSLDLDIYYNSEMFGFMCTSDPKRGCYISSNEKLLKKLEANGILTVSNAYNLTEDIVSFLNDVYNELVKR